MPWAEANYAIVTGSKHCLNEQTSRDQLQFIISVAFRITGEKTTEAKASDKLRCLNFTDQIINSQTVGIIVSDQIVLFFAALIYSSFAAGPYLLPVFMLKRLTMNPKIYPLNPNQSLKPNLTTNTVLMVAVNTLISTLWQRKNCFWKRKSLGEVTSLKLRNHWTQSKCCK